MKSKQAIKQKKCVSCLKLFIPFQSMQKACSPACALKYAREQARKREEKEHYRQTKRLKESLKTKPELTKEAQTEFNKYIRLRDHDKPCISCEKVPSINVLTGGIWDCGHYLSIGAAPELRFNELNAHKQCKQCNRDLSGNPIKYRINLIKKIGIEKVEYLEGPHSMPNWTHNELRSIKIKYRTKYNELKKEIKGKKM